MGELAHLDGARLILWLPTNRLHWMHVLLKAWGFRFCSARPWLKTWPSRHEFPLAEDAFAVGTGYEILNTTELMIIAKHGRHPQRLGNIKFAGHIIAPRREHSRKPDCVRDEIVELLDGPRCELFARSHHPGFDVWGNQVDLFDGG